MGNVLEIQGSLFAILLHWDDGCVASILILHLLLLLGLLIDQILETKCLTLSLGLSILSGSQAFEGKSRFVFGVAGFQSLFDFSFISHPIIVGADDGFQFLDFLRVVRLL